MGKVLIIGAGGVATVAAHKVAQHPEVFDEIMIASRTKAKCDAIVKAIGNPSIQTAKVDADNVEELVELLNGYKPDMESGLALSGLDHYGSLPANRMQLSGYGKLRAEGRGSF
jgi:saccharopine dehydrogenase (NAD+, L-lysine-forming)